MKCWVSEILCTCKEFCHLCARYYSLGVYDSSKKTWGTRERYQSRHDSSRVRVVFNTRRIFRPRVPPVALWKPHGWQLITPLVTSPGQSFVQRNDRKPIKIALPGIFSFLHSRSVRLSTKNRVLAGTWVRAPWNVLGYFLPRDHGSLEGNSCKVSRKSVFHYILSLTSRTSRCTRVTGCNAIARASTQEVRKYSRVRTRVCIPPEFITCDTYARRWNRHRTSTGKKSGHATRYDGHTYDSSSRTPTPVTPTPIFSSSPCLCSRTAKSMRTGSAFNRRVVLTVFVERRLVGVSHVFRINEHLRTGYGAIFVKPGTSSLTLIDLNPTSTWPIAIEGSASLRARCIRKR